MLSADPDVLSEVATWLMQTPEKKDIKKKIAHDNDLSAIIQLADYLKIPIAEVRKFSVEDFLTWIVFLEDKNRKEQQQINMAKAKSRSRR